MKHGVKHFPLYNPEPPLPEAPPWIHGYRVRADRSSAIVARACGLWPWKHIIVGKEWFTLPKGEQIAVLLHEVGHCVHWHLEKRFCMIPIFWTRYAWEVASAQELEADDYAAEHGYGYHLEWHLRRRMRIADEGGFYPSYPLRINRLEKRHAA